MPGKYPESAFDRAVDREIAEENRRAVDLPPVTCDVCGAKVEPTIFPDLFFERWTTITHSCERQPLSALIDRS